MSQDYKKLAEKQIALGKPLAIIKNSLEKYLFAEDKAEWNRVMQDEYDLLFPTYRDPNAEEVYEQQEHYLNNASNEVLLREDVDFSEFIYAQVEIDYSEDETYVQFNEWLNETRVITKAVEEERDEEGNVVVEAVAEVTEQVRSYIATIVTEDIVDSKLIELGYNYAHKRKLEYPEIEEQMDMLYKDSIDGGTRVKDAIEAVKAKYPKV